MGTNELLRVDLAARVRALWPRGNALVRRSDRVQAALLLGSVVVTALLVPVALALGSSTYSSWAAQAADQARTRHAVIATLLADTPPPTGAVYRSAAIAATSLVKARWTAPDGSTRNGMVAADTGLHAGDTTPAWVDDAGNLVAKPDDPGAALPAAIAAATCAWLGAAVTLALCYLGVATLLDRRRFAAWKREWAAIEPSWTRNS